MRNSHRTGEGGQTARGNGQEKKLINLLEEAEDWQHKIIDYYVMTP